jgi:hypothetical protein
MKGEPSQTALIAAAQAAGWKIRVGGQNHTFLYPPDGSRPITLSVNHSKAPKRNDCVKRARAAGLAI